MEKSYRSEKVSKTVGKVIGRHRSGAVCELRSFFFAKLLGPTKNNDLFIFLQERLKRWSFGAWVERYNRCLTVGIVTAEVYLGEGGYNIFLVGDNVKVSIGCFLSIEDCILSLTRTPLGNHASSNGTPCSNMNAFKTSTWTQCPTCKKALS